MIKNNKGAALFELIVSIGFLSIIMINAFVITNTILRKNSLLYEDQIERKTINNVVSKIGQDLYAYRILNINQNNGIYTLYLNRNKDDKNKTIHITSEGLNYDNTLIKNNSAVTFNSIQFFSSNNLLTLVIKYNGSQEIKIYSINYKGEQL